MVNNFIEENIFIIKILFRLYSKNKSIKFLKNVKLKSLNLLNCILIRIIFNNLKFIRNLIFFKNYNKKFIFKLKSKLIFLLSFLFIIQFYCFK